ncbi:c-type cytochrome, partial [Aliarcobacter butzleri]|uniref:c-type cytochrome n=1 Tax=Aliarcobacter butzleri TaxID=28197 RepID=UPI003AF6798D
AAYVSCKACRGAKGEINVTTKSASHVPPNLTKAEIGRALHGYKDGTYGGPMRAIMKGQVAKISDGDIKALADYMGK